MMLLSLSNAQDYSNDYADYNNGGGGGSGDSYQDYTDPYSQPDNLYADYAATKMEGGGAAAG